MKTRKIFATLFVVTGVLLLGTFPAFAGSSHPLVVLAAATAVPLATQTKILAVVAAVYAVLQVVKKFVPVTGLGSVLFNILLSVGGVLAVAQPQDLYSVQTITTVLLAALGAAGVHGTVRSFSSGDSPGVGANLTTMKLLALACMVLAFAGFKGCNKSLDQITRDVLATSSGTLTQAQDEYVAECQANPAKQVCVLINQAGGVQNATITALETYCGYALTPTPPDPSTPCTPVASAQAGLITATSNLNQIIGELKPLIQPKAKPPAAPTPTVQPTPGGAF